MRYLTICVAVAALTVSASAQTTGFPGFNDYTINGLGSGSTSCTSLTIATPTLLTLNVSAAPFTPVALYISLAPCTTTALSFGTCQGTNLHLQLAPPPIPLVAGLTDAAGNFTYLIPLPLLGSPVTVATQGVLFCVPSFLPLFTQAYDLTLL